MPEPTDDQRRSAHEIVDRLFQIDEWLARPVPVRVEALLSGLSILDLEFHAPQFHAEIALLELLGLDSPAMPLDDEYHVPVSLAVVSPHLFGPPLTVAPLAPLRYRRRYLDRYLSFFGPDLERILDELYERMNLVPLELREAQRVFVERASEALSHRVANAQGADEDPPDTATMINIPPTAGAAATLVATCRFTVSTNTSGLRVFWSGAYYIRKRAGYRPLRRTGSWQRADGSLVPLDAGVRSPVDAEDISPGLQRADRWGRGGSEILAGGNPASRLPSFGAPCWMKERTTPPRRPRLRRPIVRFAAARPRRYPYRYPIPHLHLNQQVQRRCPAGELRRAPRDIHFRELAGTEIVRLVRSGHRQDELLGPS